MVWAGGSYTKGNNATGGWTGDASLGIGIEAGRHDTQDNDFATGINQCLNKDGSNPATGPLNAGGFKLTNAADGTVTTDATTLRQVQAQAYIWCGTSGGSANAQTLTPSPAIAAYAAGQMFRFIAGFTSTGALTLQVSGLASPVTCLMKNSKVAFGTLAPVMAGLTYEALYDGTNFLISDLLELGQFTNDAGAARLKLFKSRATTAGTNTIVQNGDGLGQIDFYGASGSEYTRGAFINATVTGTPGATNDMPTSLTFATAADGSGTPTERARILPSGEVLIGTTTSITSAYKLQVGSASGSNLAAVIGGSSAVADGAALAIFNGAAVSGQIGNYSAIQGGAYNGGFTVKNSGSSLYLIGVTAAVGTHFLKWNNVSGAWTYDTSSARYKQDIENLPYGLDEVLAMRPVTFTYKAEPTRHDVGFIAEEMEQVIPEVVAKNLDGEPDAISYDRLTSVLCKAIQELEARVAALEGA
jgi:hypothetical protein